MNHAQSDHGEHGGTGHGHAGHGWMMLACCIPMLVIAIVLVAVGAASPSFIFGAIACTVMMAMMMGGMSHGDSESGSK